MRAMTKREIGFLACRLLAVYLFMQGIWRLSDAVSSLNFLNYTASSGKLAITFNGGNSDATTIVLMVILRLLPVVLIYAGVLGLWVFAGEVAKRLFDGAPAEIEQGTPLTMGTDVRAVAFCCLGLFFLVNDFMVVASLLARPVANLLSASVTNYNDYGLPPWELVVRISISLWLIFGARGLAGLWRMAQRNGRSIETVDHDRR